MAEPEQENTVFLLLIKKTRKQTQSSLFLFQILFNLVDYLLQLYNGHRSFCGGFYA